VLQQLAQRCVRRRQADNESWGEPGAEPGEGDDREHCRVDHLVRARKCDGADGRHPGDVEDDELDGERHAEGEVPGASAGGGAHAHVTGQDVTPVTGRDVTPAAGGVKDSCA